MIKTIVFATDLGAFTAHSLLHVESLAKQFDAKVVILHALAPMGEYASAFVQSHYPDADPKAWLDGDQPETLATLKEQIFESLLRDPAAERALVDRVVDIVVTVGSPASVILQTAQKLSADLIVIGSHGVDAIDGSVLGSVASKVLQLAKIPVYMVPMVNPTHFRGEAAVKLNWVRQ